MTANIQYFCDRLDFIPRRSNETHVFSNDQYLDTLTFFGEILAIVTYGFYYASNHSIDRCPVFQDGLNAPINTFEKFSPRSQTWYDPYSNGYDQGW